MNYFLEEHVILLFEKFNIDVDIIAEDIRYLNLIYHFSLSLSEEFNRNCSHNQPRKKRRRNECVDITFEAKFLYAQARLKLIESKGAKKSSTGSP